jgi:hypothetical protein
MSMSLWRPWRQVADWNAPLLPLWRVRGFLLSEESLP